MYASTLEPFTSTLYSFIEGVYSPISIILHIKLCFKTMTTRMLKKIVIASVGLVCLLSMHLSLLILRAPGFELFFFM